MERAFRHEPPPPGGRVLDRPRLVDALGARFDLLVVTLEAGAGFGKTTLLAQAIRDNAIAPRGRDVYVACEPGDADGEPLVQALAAQLSSAPTVDAVAEAVWSRAPEPVALVFDDVHRIAHPSAGTDVLRALLEALPANGHVLLAGRSAPPLPLARLEAAGRATRIGETTLRFSPDEVDELATRHGVARELFAPLAGWPALMEVATQRHVSGVWEFLAEEVLTELSESARRTFAELCVLGGGEVALTRDAGPHDLDELAQLPLVAVDEGAIRPHQLWIDAVAPRVVDPDAVMFHAADVLRARGDFDHAFDLLAEVGAWDPALGCLLEACNDQRRPPSLGTMVRWRERVPQPRVDSPEVTYLEFLITREREPWSGRADELLDRCQQAFAARRDVGGELRAAIRASYIAWDQGDTHALDRIYERWIPRRGQIPGLDVVASVNRLAWADAAVDPVALRAELDVMPVGPVEPRLRFFVPMFRAHALLDDGRPDEAVEHADDAAALAATCDGAGGTLLAAMLPALCRWLRGDPDVGADDLPEPRDAYAVVERAELVAWRHVLAAAAGQVPPTFPIDPRPGSSPRVDGLRWIAGVLAGDATGPVPEHPLARRPMRWWPAVPLLAGADASVADGAGRVHVEARELAAVFADARDGRTPRLGSWATDTVAVRRHLSFPGTAELAAALEAGGDPRGGDLLDELCTTDPGAARVALRDLAATGSGEVARGAKALAEVLPVPPSRTLHIDVLGPLRLRHGERECVARDWRREKVRALLSVLILQEEVRRAELAALLWPDHDEDAASANLRLTLHYLHGVLEPERGKGDPPYFVQQDLGVLRLHRRPELEVDAWVFEADLARAADAQRAGATFDELTALRTATDRWRGVPYDGIDHEWATLPREHLRTRMVQASLRLGDLAVAAGDADAAAEAAHRALLVEPWSEAAYALLMRSHLARADRAGARRAAEACRAMLDDLGAGPTPEVESLIARCC